MAVFVTEQSVSRAARQMIAEAKRSLDISSGWITGPALRLLLESARPRIEQGQLEVRVVYRLKEMSDLDITELSALEEFAEIGASVRYCKRVHAKMIVVDRDRVLISSSNVTATAGYTFRPEQQSWTNYEAGVLLDASDGPAVADAQAQFERIWSDSQSLSDEVVGSVIGQPATTEFDFVVLKGIRRAQYVVADCDGGYVLGRIEEIRTVNTSFPEMEQPAQLRDPRGYSRRPLPDLQSLFSGASKERALLLTTTFYDPAAAFSIASVRVIKQWLEGRLQMALSPTAPGALVRVASSDLLSGLQGDGELELGCVLNHPDVAVRLKASEIAEKHCAIYGMTGAGKSNGLKVLVRSLAATRLVEEGSPWQTRIIVIDPHGEYAAEADRLHPRFTQFEVTLPDVVNIFDEYAVRSELNLRMIDGGLNEALWTAVGRLESRGEVVEIAALIDHVRKLAPRPGSASDRLVKAYDRTPSRFVIADPTPSAVIGSKSGSFLEMMSNSALYVLNLRGIHDAGLRSEAVGWIMDEAFAAAKATDGVFRTVFAIDEVQNFAPESGLDEVRHSLDATLRIAREGRKFGVGLIISSQRPASVNTNLRSQMNSHLIFRLVNANDLGAVAASVDAAERSLVEYLLPHLDIGTCFAAGTAIDYPFFVVMPFFRESRPQDREVLSVP